MPRVYIKKTHCIRGHALTPDNRVGGLGQCKKCSRLSFIASKERNPNYKKEWRCKHKERLRLDHILTRYNLTKPDYEKLLVVQNNQCAICGIKFGVSILDNTPHVDHNHENLRVRGLLCRRCNSGLGQFGDRVESLLKAIDYLKADGIVVGEG